MLSAWRISKSRPSDWKSDALSLSYTRIIKYRAMGGIRTPGAVTNPDYKSGAIDQLCDHG